MCWSATADLWAGLGIAAVGVASLASVRRPGDAPLAALPLLLGAHQIVEAAVWHGGGGTGPATLAWAVIALPLLPLWVPAGVLAAARPADRPRLLAPLAAGTATAGFLAYRLATRPVTAEIRGHTLGYAVDLPYAPLVLAGYLLATVGALLLARDRLLRLLGLVTGAGAALCALLWRTEFLSTWCALAAVASLLLLRWIRRRP
ncbi:MULTISPECIES: DUF6629 family protein [Streptomyces]|uniref:Integral membrane protein n=3 Tax=Streptomyces venezuelae TaxID=54571 RepID=F2R1T3_STRVP|nr:DUF6629 family protein [Streptomyces venezuelae]APE25900.1 hypothetical protein vnz_36050 [Streptomyces venezuelae]QES03237.1 hypothetical protein DEJ43_36625 [Streptomyces venezuelae ATCC 10712]CCA60600.1 hypothetical protein SVEN_7314 [Streptomyces venezuelae ATCC 10712]